LLQPEEDQTSRDADLAEMRSILSACAERLGIVQEAEAESVVWKTPKGQISHHYFFTVTTVIAEFVLNLINGEHIKKVIIFPGSRSRLMDYRLNHDPRLESAAEQNWHFVKFRTLRRLVRQEHLTLELWNELLDSDPPLWDPPVQFQLF